MENTINIKIYRDGEYSVRDNLEFKARSFMRYKLPVICGKIDNFFVNH